MYNTYLYTNGHWTWVTNMDERKYRKVEPIVRDDRRIRIERVKDYATVESYG